MEKPVSEMTDTEYFEYLKTLPTASFMNAIAHDIKKVVSIAHGYISLIRLDIEEDILNGQQIQEYTEEMRTMFEKSYMYMDQAQAAYGDRFPGDDTMIIIAHDIKKFVSVAHGYISLLHLDIEEGVLNAHQVQEYVAEMENMFEKTYGVIEDAEEGYRSQHGV